MQTPAPPTPPLLGDLDPFGDVAPRYPEDDRCQQPGVIFNSGI